MVFVQALIALLTRSAGRLLNTAFAWATVLLFGRVSEKRQVYVSVIAFGSVIWLVVLAGVAFPFIATFLLSFVKPPEWVDKKWIRLAMLGAVLLIPLLVGVVSILMLDRERRPRGARAIAATILRGYPYTVGLAVTLAMMTVFAPILKMRTLVKRWTAEHVPVIVTSEDYPQIVTAIQRALATSGLATGPRRAPWMLRAPTRILTTFARSAVADLVADQMTMLVSPKIEVVLHPSDLVISGRPGTAARARAIIAQRLVFTPAYMTWTKEGNEIEDRLTEVWEARAARGRGELRRTLDAIARDLERLEISYEEWEMLFRAYLLVERALYVEDRTEAPGEPSWVESVSAGLVVAAPEVSRVARSLEALVALLRGRRRDDRRHAA